MAVSRDALPEQLLTDIKLDLGITWQDEATEAKLRRLIAAGMIYLNKKLGEETDYEKDGDPRTLLFEYVRYSRDAALDVFENNYRSLLLSMQNGRAVKLYVESATETEE